MGYKDTSGQFGDFLRCLNHFRGTDFMLFQGMTQLAGVSLLMGADGFIPNISPVVPELCLKVYDYAKAGDIEKLRKSIINNGTLSQRTTLRNDNIPC